jgi:biopolymer transport protein ExbD
VAFGKKGEEEGVRLNLSPMIDVVFLILIYFIVSMQMEPSLDNIIKLPPVYKASEQEDALLQIYVLPAKVGEGGKINADSTGLIAFSDKTKTPETCPHCGQQLLDENGLYIPNSLLHLDGAPIGDLQVIMAEAFGEGGAPPAFLCSNCGNEVGPYLKLDDIPEVLKEKKKEVLDMMVRRENFEREEMGKAPLTKAEEKKLEKDVALMIKADRQAFYGRILQVVAMARDTSSDIRKFAFVTDPGASEEVKSKMAERKAKAGGE